MKGYVKNISSNWTHAMKRSVGPGAKIPLSELYDQYGEKHDLKQGEEFVEWLKSVKLRDTNRWRVIYDEDNSVKGLKECMDDRTPEKDKKKVVDNVAPIVPNKMDVQDIVSLPVRKAREVVPKVKDLNLLKYALTQAGQLSGKDSLCIILRRRIRDLQLRR
jgi:hypothetical protein